MPEIGDIARACDVGLGSSYHKCSWLACKDCGKARWVLLRGGKPQSARCHPCGAAHRAKTQSAPRGKDHWHWKGGRQATTNGYVEVWLDPSSPYVPMAGKDGYVYEHRLVMAHHLGRSLDQDEEVHHRNKDRHDNRLQNLELLSKREHAFRHQDVNYLMQQIAILEEENRRLKVALHEQETETP